MLPKALQNWWVQQFTRRQGAFLSLNPDGLMVSSGGDLGIYGLDTPEPDLPIPSQFDLLWGLFPWEEPISLPFVELEGHWAEVHLWKTEGVYWVVLLEVTQAARLQQAWQQSLNAMAMERR